VFSVTSTELTYGFGLFRDDNSMATQMQVVPGRENNLLWTCETAGVHSIHSTE
jgi:cytochrome c oxidase subunit II